MSDNQLCDQCVQGVIHEGTPVGKLETINGIVTYVGIPEGDYAKDKAVLFLCDAFALGLVNNKLLVDSFAKNGYQTYAPDIFDGEPAPADRLTPDGKPFDVPAWIGRHPPSRATEIVKAVMEGLKEKGVTKFAATGYCYGARLVFNLSFENAISVSAVSHASLAGGPRPPLLINSCEEDHQFPKEKQEKADAVLGDGKFTPGYAQHYFEGCQHGFAVRGDLSDPKVKAGKEGSFKNTVEWFIKYL
ncbi:alpha/beta-hydrolase [Artomyces pyxidatus]|uniref:Alpha/beta-hydrolase n=1 Tax=Artomyces pyxidatus TaxID=48021 RepID=A0ACB8T9D2_9AGAM|nr:alpha/beta-hydrolase [Artomyces pyxidatus]